jgi:hypothetical protein
MLNYAKKHPIQNRSRKDSQPKTEEQKAESQRMKYAKKHPIQKRSRKNSMKPLQSNNGNLIILWIVSIYFCVGKLLSHEAK